MKKVLIALFCVFLSASAFADQLAWISKLEAESAVKLLEKQKVVLLYCGCCDNDPMQYVKISKVSCQKNGFGYYEVFVTGVDASGNRVSEAIDLAYAHIKKGDKALCVGLALGLECDPCVKNIKWNCPASLNGR